MRTIINISMVTYICINLHKNQVKKAGADLDNLWIAGRNGLLQNGPALAVLNGGAASMSEKSPDALQVSEGHRQVKWSPTSRIHHLEIGGGTLRQCAVQLFHRVLPDEAVKRISVRHHFT